MLSMQEQAIPFSNVTFASFLVLALVLFTIVYFAAILYVWAQRTLPSWSSVTTLLRDWIKRVTSVQSRVHEEEEPPLGSKGRMTLKKVFNWREKDAHDREVESWPYP
jgi:hypothetical protein